jgi:pyruvate kinase
MKTLFDELFALSQSLIKEETHFKEEINAVHASYRASALNLVHYMALRATETRVIQDKLTAAGFSSFRNSEGHVLSTIQKVLQNLARASNTTFEAIPSKAPDYFDKNALLEAHTTRLLGTRSKSYHSAIMVTLPTEAAFDEKMIADYLNAGMDIARINCSHDNVEVWQSMAQLVRRVALNLNKHCNVHFDLGGPKIRTQSLFTSKKGPVEDFSLKVGDFVYAFIKEEDAIQHINAKAGQKCFTVTLPQLITDTKEGHSIWFDDGKIEGLIIHTKPGRIKIEIKRIDKKGTRLKPDKGINVPDSMLKAECLTSQDLQALPYLLPLADSIACSFIQSAEDVKLIQDTFKNAGREDIGLILKIETRGAFHELPKLLLQGMQSPNIGIMIARGDLAVELGFERLAEVQEELLWLSEAAHIPVIWATQVLEQLSKKGIASRAEITDAAMSSRAEAVMLNKGPYTTEAIITLNRILNQMSSHWHKKQSVMRPLSIAQHFIEEKHQHLETSV